MALGVRVLPADFTNDNVLYHALLESANCRYDSRALVRDGDFLSM